MESRVRVAERMQMELAAVDKQVELSLGEMNQCGHEISAMLKHASDTQGRSSFTSLLIPAEHARKRSADTFARKKRELEEMERTSDAGLGPAMVTWIMDAIGSLVDTGTLDAVKDVPFPKTGRGQHDSYFTKEAVIRAADGCPQGFQFRLNVVDCQAFMDRAQPVLENSGYECTISKGGGYDSWTYRDISIRFEPLKVRARDTHPPVYADVLFGIKSAVGKYTFKDVPA